MTAHPKISVVATTVLLLALTSPLLTLKLGSGGVGMLPEDSDERHAFEVIIAEFSDGIITADVVVLAPDVTVAAVQHGVEDVTASIAG